MEVRTKHTLQASRKDVLAHMLDRAYLDALVEGIDFLNAIEEVSVEEQPDGKLLRVLRYEARTQDKIPSFLKRYADKAPEFVHWEQRELWDMEAGKMTFGIVAEVPDHWQRYYTQSGELTFSEISQGAQTKLESRLSYAVNVFGLKRLIEKAAHKEVSALLDLQGRIAASYFL